MIAMTVGAAAALIGVWLTPDARLVGAVLAFALAWAAAVDIDRFILPDLLTLGLVVLGLCLALASGIDAARPYILGTVLGYGSLASLAWIYRRVRGRNGLGMGDAKLLAAAGAWLGWAALPFVILIASLTCLISIGLLAAIQMRSTPKQPMLAAYIPFGPYLACAIFIVWLAQKSGHV
ncbi:MAG TPA: A24 family peptidase [Hyphomonadaceae bacterium]|nr:A24 family peptidase [Hyphomonadaceae bacterium]